MMLYEIQSIGKFTQDKRDPKIETPASGKTSFVKSRKVIHLWKQPLILPPIASFVINLKRTQNKCYNKTL